ncbi:MAG: aminoglycoside phosphotransferase family protein [Nocardioides sp.]|uniref:aminoglycoside phosphotransferase family protein n=1 Tax=Nocardioides sp. TaxID=35761 RepID=UPI0039E2B62E
MTARRAVEIPATLAAVAQRGDDWAAWVGGLPALAARLLEEWELRHDGDATHGFTALVLPVTTRDRRRAALKIAFPDEETEHEALALQHWHGRGAVRLIRANPRLRALLLEQLLPVDLMDQWDVRACEIVGGLYRRLHVEAPPQLRPLSRYAAALAERLAALPRGVPLPPRLVDQARSLAIAFAEDDGCDGRLIHGDLHYGNVLAAVAGTPGEETGEWKAIDPKPLSGDPHYEVAPLLVNRYDELAGRVRDGVRERFFAAVDAGELDEQRARGWVVVRAMDLAAQRLAEPGPRATSDHDWLTRCVAIAKAVQD